MSDTLYTLMEAGSLSPLSYYFARFVARGCGVEQDSVLARSAALVSMRNLKGDVCVDLAEYAGQPLFEGSGDEAIAEPRGQALDDWVETLRVADWVGESGAEAPLILDGRHLYLGKYWHFEQQVASALLERMSLVDNLDLPLLAQGLESLFPKDTAKPSDRQKIAAAIDRAADSGPPADEADEAIDWQKVAAAIAASRRFAVISGGPGTGKTTTVVKVLALLLGQDATLRIALAAPTGKAAARLTDAVRRGKGRAGVDAQVLARIPEEAGTIHRLLGAGFGDAFKHNRDTPLLIDCLVVDEASMIDLPLMARLLEALPDRARIILLGDRDQLASVEAGNVLGDITGHGQEIRYSKEQIRFLEQVEPALVGKLPGGGDSTQVSDAVGLLRVSHRFEPDSGVGALSKEVNAGQGEDALDLFQRGGFKDIAWMDARDDALNPACVDWAVKRYARYLRKDDVVAALLELEESRVLAALHRGPFGVDEINRLISARLQSEGLIRGGAEYQGKPVMVTTNDYEVGLFNGDIGLLWRDGNQVLRAYFMLGDNQIRSVSVRQLPEHTSAYALTVHKSQGSEFDEVLLVLPFDRSPVVTRELIYTGITRARKNVTIQGSRETFIEGCRSGMRRTSALAEKLGWSSSS
jgi:exodeoxyribonuclease V alpha subunit